jgi:ABC-type sugar transport system permease subunit
MIILFIITLFLTFIIIRTLAYSFHDMKNYGTKNEKSKTLTGYLRIKTGYDWHHFHFGILILLITLSFILTSGFNTLSVIFLAIGISMMIDQSVPIIDRKSNYFHFKNVIISIIFHIIVSLLAIIIFLNF